MPRLKHRSIAPWIRWAALVGMACVWLCGPAPARAAADPHCVAAEAISELEPSERARLQGMCEGTVTRMKPSDETTITAGLRLEGWKAAFVAEALARAKPAPVERVERQKAAEAWVAERLTRTRTQRGAEVPACETFREVIADAIPQLESGKLVLPPSLDDLAEDDACVGKDEQERLAAISGDYHLLTIPARDKDRIEAWAVDLDQLLAHPITPVSVQMDDQHAWLLVLPRDQMLTVSVHQPNLDSPWVETQRLVDLDFTLPRRKAECVIIEAGTDEGSTWQVIVNGAPSGMDTVANTGTGQITQRAILNLPEDLRGRKAQTFSGFRVPREVVFVSDREGTAPWASTLAQPRDQDHGRCQSVAYDLSGLHSPKEHIGVAQVSVSRSCRTRGIVPSRIRSYVEQYTNQSGKTLIPLDAWAEVMEVFRDLEGRLGSQAQAERGASRGDLDDSEQMVVLASELRRRGVDSLLYFDVRCPGKSTDTTVIGTRVDLEDFVGRSRSKVTGVNTEDLLAVRSHDSHSHDLRESMEVVLSDLLGQPHVRFINPADHVERGSPTRLRAVGDGTGVEIEVWPLRGVSGPAICAEIEELNELSSFDAFTTLHQKVARQQGKPKLWDRSDTGTAEVEVGGLRKGEYVAIATGITADGTPTRNDTVGHAMCFSVSERELEIVVDLSGYKQRTQPRNSPVSTRQSFVRIGAGVRYTSWEYFEFGARIGYELVEYASASVPNWDNLVEVDLPNNGQVSLNWRRHGLFVAPMAGLRVPFGRWPWPLCRKSVRCDEIKARRRANPSLLTYFLDAQVAVNFGIASIRDLPQEIVETERNTVLEPDLDLGFKTGFRVRPRQATRFGVFAGLLLTDILNASTNGAAQQDFWTNDWGIRGTVGLEVALGMRLKKP